MFIAPPRYTWAMALLTMGAYSFLMYVYVPLPHAQDFRLHLYGMWAGFFMAATLIAYVVIQIRAALAQREAALAQGREAALRDERIVALATLAAGAAHELGTPLSTMAIVVNELRAEARVGDMRERLTLLREQIARCKQTLATLAAAAGQTKAQGGHSMPLDAYLEQLLAQWRRTRLDLDVATIWRGRRPASHDRRRRNLEPGNRDRIEQCRRRLAYRHRDRRRLGRYAPGIGGHGPRPRYRTRRRRDIGAHAVFQ